METTKSNYKISEKTERLIDALKFVNIDLFAKLTDAVNREEEDDLTDPTLLKALLTMEARLKELIADNISENVLFYKEENFV